MIAALRTASFLLLAIMPTDKGFTGSPEAGDAARPVSRCSRLSADCGSGMDSIRTELAWREPLALKQSWRETLEPAFAGGAVATAWDEEFLYIFATLQDQDIFNPLRGWNEPFYQAGDIFEILIRPLRGEAYFEFHVTPHGDALQLRFPRRTALSEFHEAGGKPADLLKTFRIEGRLLETHAEIQAESKSWTVLVKIPAALLVRSGRFQPGEQFLVSFCRYDHTRGQSAPVLSSSSNHPVCSFHRQEEWRLMVLE